VFFDKNVCSHTGAGRASPWPKLPPYNVGVKGADRDSNDNNNDNAAYDDVTLEVLRPALELAFLVAAFGSRQKTPLAVPDELAPFVRSQKMPSAAIGPLCRAIDGDEAFRQRIAVAADEAAVGRAGVLWLRRPEGWSAELARVIAGEEPASAAVMPDKALLKRAEAAERDLRSVRAELSVVKAELATRDRAGRDADATARKLERLRTEAEATAAKLHKKLGAAATEVEKLRSLADEQREHVASVKTELVAVRRELASSLPREELLAALASARTAIDGAHAAVARTAKHRASAPDRVTRIPLRLPRGLTVREAAGIQHLLAVTEIVVMVDGYNVAKLAWPTESLAVQRDRLNDLSDELVTRYGTDLRVVYDGAAPNRAAGSRSRRFAIEFTAEGVTADDIIVERIRSLPASQPVVLVTNDAALTRRCERLGVTTVRSDAFLTAR
jgi:YacP-like NYN domain